MIEKKILKLCYTLYAIKGKAIGADFKKSTSAMDAMDKLSNLLEPYANQTHLECDGLSRILHSLLENEGIKHTVFVGAVCHYPSQRKIPVHFWIDLDSGLRIDYRLQMWLGVSADIPNGIFDSKDFTNVCYEGEVVEMPVLPKSLIDILLMPI